MRLPGPEEETRERMGVERRGMKYKRAASPGGYTEYRRIRREDIIWIHTSRRRPYTLQSLIPHCTNSSCTTSPQRVNSLNKTHMIPKPRTMINFLTNLNSPCYLPSHSSHPPMLIYPPYANTTFDTTEILPSLLLPPYHLSLARASKNVGMQSVTPAHAALYTIPAVEVSPR